MYDARDLSDPQPSVSFSRAHPLLIAAAEAGEHRRQQGGPSFWKVAVCDVLHAFAQLRPDQRRTPAFITGPSRKGQAVGTHDIDELMARP